MPYIEQKDRCFLEVPCEIMSQSILTAGDLNYAITTLCKNHLGDKLSYAKINEVIGVLECAKQEFYRRVAVPYENAKMAEHGDVY